MSELYELRLTNSKLILENPVLHRILWIFMTVVILAGDFYFGPHIQFPIIYFIPIAIATWFGGKEWGVGLAVGFCIIRFLFTAIWQLHYTLLESTINTAINVVIFSVFVLLLGRLIEQKRALDKRVKVLEGILPICGFCKKIRREDGTWEVIESYISDRSEAQFSHGFCPDCARIHYPEFYKE